MVIRLARQSDLPSISKILAIGFHDEEVAGPILHPYRIQYPNDYLTFWRRRTFVSFWDYSRAFLVSCENDEKTGKELVVGVAEWTRVGLGWEKLWKLWGPLDPSKSGISQRPLYLAAMMAFTLQRFWTLPLTNFAFLHQED